MLLFVATAHMVQDLFVTHMNSSFLVCLPKNTATPLLRCKSAYHSVSTNLRPLLLLYWVFPGESCS